MRICRSVAVGSTATIVIMLAACSTTMQTGSGQDWLRALPNTVQSGSAAGGSIDQQVRAAANVEPLLRFPARIGVARLDKAGLVAIPADEAAVWTKEGQDLGPEYGAFVPISPLIAGMMAPTYTAAERSTPMRQTIDTIRLAAAREHLDAVIIYEADATADSKDNPLSIADWTLIGAFVLPSQDVKALGVAQAVMIDVRNGYHYGTIEASADDKTVAARFANHEVEKSLSDRVKIAAVENLTREAHGLVQGLKAKLGARVAQAAP
jgi:hypothetical protein